ncbi:unnamed protein product [Acanthoscelides obtectus]|uniref:Malectin domain-containing protein n=1 Tax=Acanthoscelides obtectus TaxID=200917 RepID=A0A9P0PSX8_ACAOB|nr:unnamed protein product [Acanthoscelides obtectus]CAK1668234.1 Malectin-A [Acanthoscelides obtectus]
MTMQRKMTGKMVSPIFAELLAVVLVILVPHVQCSGQVVYAVNCGGEAHTDSYGIRYERDPLNGKVGIASDYGKRLLIGRVPPNDYILYQTERYHTNTFGYDIPFHSDGEYVLVLKFCEVYFNSPDQKVFDVVLNGEHTVVSDLDIFEKVGRGVAHDEYIPFKISKEKFQVGIVTVQSSRENKRYNEHTIYQQKNSWKMFVENVLREDFPRTTHEYFGSYSSFMLVQLVQQGTIQFATL